MTTARDPELQRFLDQARETADQRLPEGARETGVFRFSACWPKEQVEHDAALGEAVARALGPDRTSVFSFLRYYDYARWQPGLGALAMSSEQRDWYLPRFVYWALTPNLFLYQQSQQPAYTGLGLSETETARYVADAIDCVGQLYRALGVAGEVWLDIGVRLANSPGADGTSGPDLSWKAAHAPDEWISAREQLASKCVRTLLEQAKSPSEHNGAVARLLRVEFDHLNERRALAK